MFRKLVKATEIEIDGQRYAARYFEQKTARGSAALQLRGDPRCRRIASSWTTTR